MDELERARQVAALLRAAGEAVTAERVREVAGCGEGAAAQAVGEAQAAEEADPGGPFAAASPEPWGEAEERTAARAVVWWRVWRAARRGVPWALGAAVAAATAHLASALVRRWWAASPRAAAWVRTSPPPLHAAWPAWTPWVAGAVLVGLLTGLLRGWAVAALRAAAMGAVAYAVWSVWRGVAGLLGGLPLP